MQRDQYGRVGWFIIVGIAAAAVHWVVARTCVAWAGWEPLIANIAGWLIAFTVSFSGHHFLSFRGHGNPAGQSALRFFCISAMGFAVNEVAYAALLHWTQARYDLLLALVLVAVAGVTYMLSRRWAFLGTVAA